LKGENSLFEFLEESDDVRANEKRQKKLKKLLFESVDILDFDKVKIIDESSLKFALNRLQPDPDVSALIVKVVKSYSHITDVCVRYLNRDKLDQYISEEILNIIKDKPIHDWHASQLLKLSQNLQELYVSELNEILILLFSDPYIHWILKREAIDILKNNLGETTIFTFLNEFKNNLDGEKVAGFLPYVILLFRACLVLNFRLTINCLTEFIHADKNVYLPDDMYIYLAYYSTFHKEDLPDFLKNQSWAKTYLSPASMDDLDGISHNLVHFYSLPSSVKFKVDFRDYLEKDEYEAALDSLCHACACFEKEPDSYFNYCDSFNQIMLANIYKRDGINNIPKYDHGNIIGKLNSHIPALFSAFHECHILRCKNPRSHAYNSTGTSINKRFPKLFPKKDSLRRSLASAYEALIEYIAERHIHKIGGF